MKTVSNRPPEGPRWKIPTWNPHEAEDQEKIRPYLDQVGDLELKLRESEALKESLLAEKAALERVLGSAKASEPLERRLSGMQRENIRLSGRAGVRNKALMFLAGTTALFAAATVFLWNGRAAVIASQDAALQKAALMEANYRSVQSLCNERPMTFEPIRPARRAR